MADNAGAIEGAGADEIVPRPGPDVDGDETPTSLSGSSAFVLYCRGQQASSNNRFHCASVRSGRLVLALPNMGDNSQLWVREDRGNGSFMLVNKSTNLVAKIHGEGDQLILVNKPQTTDRSVLWTQDSQSHGGFHFIRSSISNMVMEAYRRDIADGTPITIWSQNVPTAHHQLWQFYGV
ncbi:hypothetical protein vseg_006951 [Gypsophila vaccaria]